MAEEKEKTFLIVNPKGAMHEVTEEHARARLRIAGWRLATKEEQTAYFAANGNQRFNRPLAKPFNPEPDVEDALEAALKDPEVASVKAKAEREAAEKAKAEQAKAQAKKAK